MNKKIFVICILICLAFLLVGCSSNKTNSVENENSNTINNSSNVTNNSYEAESLSLSKPIAESTPQPVEETISTFSTNILDKSSGRQTNIELTCSVLNGSIVKSGETFSFCDTVGKATPERGYQKAKIFDSDGNVTMGYGGGNCQVSSTLYNAILQNSSFEVVERHPHAQAVDYVENGKDASVACGSVDFKFKNNANYNIRIDASTDGNQVTVSLIKI